MITLLVSSNRDADGVTIYEYQVDLGDGRPGAVVDFESESALTDAEIIVRARAADTRRVLVETSA